MEGPTLADRILQGSIPLDGALRLGQDKGVVRVAENGSKPQFLVGVKDGQAWDPQVLPGGEAVLFTLATKLRGLTGATTETWDKARIVVLSLRTGERTTLPHNGTEASYVRSGHIVYMVQGTQSAVPFDIARMQVTGGPVPVVEGVKRPTFGTQTPGTASYSVSDTGSLVFVPGLRSGLHEQSDLVRRVETTDALELTTDDVDGSGP